MLAVGRRCECVGVITQRDDFGFVVERSGIHHCFAQCFHCQAGIGADRDRRQHVTCHLFGFDVDTDHLTTQFELVVEQEGVGLAEFGANGEHHVGRLQRIEHRTLWQPTAEVQWMIGWQYALGVDRERGAYSKPIN